MTHEKTTLGPVCRYDPFEDSDGLLLDVARAGAEVANCGPFLEYCLDRKLLPLRDAEFWAYPEEAMPRILVACDEIGELTDTAGLDKPSKELVTAIVGKLATIARLGRAFGIHLVLATQRPDANVLPGQIKNNLDIRICGRSDLVLSQIILDNGDAAALPKDIPGRFLCNLNDGTVFQGYAFESALSKKGGGK